MIWSYGVMTVPSRANDLFPKTLASLVKAGFDTPHVFADGVKDPSQYSHLNLPITTRWPAIRTFGNWFGALLELYVRQPEADRYAIFQDDLIAYTNLRQYLETQTLGEKEYWNLFTFPPTRQLPPPDPNVVGWYKSNQRGRGAVGLVFNRLGVFTLLSSSHMLERPQCRLEAYLHVRDYAHDPNPPKWYKGEKGVDGGICTAFEKADVGWTELIHNPSLTQHQGTHSSMYSREHEQAPTFKGEDFNAMELLTSGAKNETCNP